MKPTMLTPHLGSCKKVTSIRGQRLPIYQVDSTLILFFFLQACKSNHFFLQSPHSLTSTTATTMAQKPKLTLFVDIVSPFGYYAFHTLQVMTRTHHQNWRRRRKTDREANRATEIPNLQPSRNNLHTNLPRRSNESMRQSPSHQYKK